MGLKLLLSKGTLTAQLNHAGVSANHPLPLNQWVQVAAIYDGTSLTLYQDGNAVGSTTGSTDMGWQGDYTLDYNYEAPFWAALATNHLELAESYEQPLLGNMPRAAHNSVEKFHHPGLAYYTHLIPMPGWDSDNTEFMNQKGCTLFAMVDCVMRWKYTHDP